MTEPKHTPGAWAVNGARFENDADFGRVHVESRAEHGWANDGCVICGCEGPDAFGNARLIAVAPEMFEQLEWMLMDKKLRHPKSKRDEAMIASAERIIAKASGEKVKA